MKHAVFTFDPDLLPLLPVHRRLKPLAFTFNGPQSAKHLIEALGIPHTEVGAVLVSGMPAKLGYLVRDGDQLEILGAGALEPPGSEPRFAVDGHLGRLAAALRMLGFDCLYDRQIQDDALYKGAHAEARYLLTRDRHLLMRKDLIHGCLVRSLEPPKQLEEVSRRLALARWVIPFRRCILCNAVLVSVAKDRILHRLEPLTIRYFHEFRECPSCGQIYWRGSHYEQMRARVDRILGQAGS